MNEVAYPAKSIPVCARAQVVVAGGGPAGLAAAVSAARNGASVVLVERYGFLGGNFTAASVGTLCGLYMKTQSGFDFAVGGFARELSERLKQAGAANGPIPFKETAVLLYVPWAAKRLADSLVGEEGRIRLLLHCRAVDVVMDGDTIDAIVVATKRGPQAVVGETYVDTTGDADIAFMAGVPTEIGPPGERQFASMQFFIQHADTPKAFAGLGKLADAIADHGAHLSRDSGALIPTGRPGEFIGAMTRVGRDGRPLDATDPDDLTYGEIEGRRLAEEAFDFVKEHIPGFEEAFLSDTPAQLGIRESRRIVGCHVLTGDEVSSGARFPDAVATGAWPQEYHVAGRGTEYVFLEPGQFYEIPFGSLVSPAVSNLVVAGRCISATHHALASTRVMGPSMALGQAAGTAAALASTEGVGVGSVDIEALRSALREGGAFLPEP